MLGKRIACIKAATITDLIVVFLIIDLAGVSRPELSGEINSSLVNDAIAAKCAAGKIYCSVNTLTLPLKFHYVRHRKTVDENAAPCEQGVSTL